MLGYHSGKGSAMARFYIEVARTAFRRQLIYRWANLAGLLTNIFFGAIISYVYLALFAARPLANGYDAAQTLRYIWLVQAMIMVVLPFGWIDLMLTIRSGEVVADLSKPCDFCWYWFSRELGRNVYYVLFRALPTYTAGMLLFRFGVPGGWAAMPFFALSLILASVLGLAYRYVCNLLAFWIIEARAASGLAQVIALFFAGSYVPLAFFPLWSQGVIAWLPFAGLLNVPAEIFLGKLDGAGLALALARQTCWLVALVIAARLMTATAARRVVVQGG